MFHLLCENLKKKVSKSKMEKNGMLPEMILSTKCLRPVTRKVHLKATGISLHADIFKMDISIYVFLQGQLKITKYVEIVAGRQNVQNMKIVTCYRKRFY